MLSAVTATQAQNGDPVSFSIGIPLP